MANKLRVLEAARTVVDEINRLLTTSQRPLLYENQLRNASGSITSNIREAYGRRSGAERNLFLRYARGSAEETDEQLRASFVAKRLLPARYWSIHNRLVVIRRMLTALMRD